MATHPHPSHTISAAWQQAEEQDLRSLVSLVAEASQSEITLQQMLDALSQEGIRDDDPRLERFIRTYRRQRPNGQYSYQGSIPLGTCQDFIAENKVVQDALAKRLIIPEFEAFCQEMGRIFAEVKPIDAGRVADYIPQLSRVSPAFFAVSICTVDGQRFSLGDSGEKFCLQSTCKPINYALAIEEYGTEQVHQHVGREPSGRSFNELSLNGQGLPHNPLINAGAIMCASLVRPEADLSDRYDHLQHTWTRLCAGQAVSFNNAVYLSERQTADRNFALAYFMRENKAFPPKTDLADTLDLYFQSCSIESCTDHLAVAAATLANGGVNPLTGAQIFRHNTIQYVLSLMLTCGMYDFSGEFAFKIGLPAKSGVSGAMMVVVPNVMGLSIWSPPLDALGNSVRGVAFCEKLIDTYSLHPYDSASRQNRWRDPRKRKHESTFSRVFNLIYAASKGDLDEVKRLQAEGVGLQQADYDGRTPLHLAAAENRLEVVTYLLNQGVDAQPADRWGHTPLGEAEEQNHSEMVALLRRWIEKGAV